MLPFLQQGQIQGSQSDHASQKQWWIQDFMGYTSGFKGGLANGSIASRQTPDFCLFSLKKPYVFHDFTSRCPPPRTIGLYPPLWGHYGISWNLSPQPLCIHHCPKCPEPILAVFGRFSSQTVFRDFAKFSPPNFVPGSASALKMVWFTYHWAC